MNIHGVFKLIFKCFNFGFLIEKILLFETNFSSELINASDLLLNAHKFIPLICKIRSESIELFLFIFVINLTFSKVGIWEFNFFIKNSQLLISFDKLSTKNISFIAHHIIIFLLFCFLLLSLLDNFLQMTNVVLLILNDLLSGLDLSLCSVFVSFYLHIFSFNLFILFIEFDQLLILCLNFLS